MDLQDNMKPLEGRSHLALLLVAVVVFALMELIGLVNMRAVYVDEAWYSNPAYNLLHGQGLRNTVVGSGGNANFVFPLLVSLSMKVFGASLFSIRFASVFCGLLSLPVLHGVMNEFKSRVPSRIVGYALFVSLSVFNLDFRTARPESVAILVCLVGIWCFLRYCRTRSWKDILGLSLATLVGFFSHPFTMLMFACMGGALLIRAIGERRREGIKLKKSVLHLFVLLFAALSGIVLFYFINMEANPNGASSFGGVVDDRLFARNGFGKVLSLFIKVNFVSKQGLYSIPLLALAVVMVFIAKDLRLRLLSAVCVAFVVFFPFVYSFPPMLGSCATYLATMGVCVAVGASVQFIERNSNRRKAMSLMALSMAYCLANFVLINGYNITKYDTSNTTLANDLKQHVPQSAVVFGTLDLWPFLMNTQFYSSLYRLDLPTYDFDFILTNSKQEAQCDWPSYWDQIARAEREYELVFQKETKHYGLVRLFKKRIK